MLTEKQTWLRIAEGFDIPRGERNESEEYLYGNGICCVMAILLDRQLIRPSVCSTIQDVAMEATKDSPTIWGDAYFAPLTTAGDTIRAKFCREQAKKIGDEE